MAIQTTDINFKWDTDDEETSPLELPIDFLSTNTDEEIYPENDQDTKNLPSRNSYQLARRILHIATGSTIALFYAIAFSHAQMIHILGTIACALYLAEQIRINYPETSAKLMPLSKFIMRAEEQLQESAMVPYMFGVLLTIITFPKLAAIVGIFTLAISDPLSALVGIRFGKTRIVSHKSLEGSAAFFISCFILCNSILIIGLGKISSEIFAVSTLTALVVSAFEMIPIKIDDNLTIPLFTGPTFWIICWLFGLNIA